MWVNSLTSPSPEAKRIFRRISSSDGPWAYHHSCTLSYWRVCYKSGMAISGASNSTDVSPVPFRRSISLGYFSPWESKILLHNLYQKKKKHTICGRWMFVHTVITLFMVASDTLYISANLSRLHWYSLRHFLVLLSCGREPEVSDP